MTDNTPKPADHLVPEDLNKAITATTVHAEISGLLRGYRIDVEPSEIRSHAGAPIGHTTTVRLNLEGLHGVEISGHALVTVKDA